MGDAQIAPILPSFEAVKGINLEPKILQTLARCVFERVRQACFEVEGRLQQDGGGEHSTAATKSQVALHTRLVDRLQESGQRALATREITECRIDQRSHYVKSRGCVIGRDLADNFRGQLELAVQERTIASRVRLRFA